MRESLDVVERGQLELPDPKVVVQSTCDASLAHDSSSDSNIHYGPTKEVDVDMNRSTIVGVGTGDVPLDDVSNVRFNTHATDLPVNSLDTSARLSHSDEDWLSDDGLSDGVRLAFESNL